MRNQADTEVPEDPALEQRLAQRLAALRATAGWSLDELATRSASAAPRSRAWNVPRPAPPPAC
ncbi:MAG: hypothetical protein U1E77_13570 [Inhella sp.]